MQDSEDIYSMQFAEYLNSHPCCSSPQYRLLGENEFLRTLICLSCKKLWHISRSKVKAYAREQNELERVRRISERERAAVRTTFGRYYGGAQHS